MVKERVIRPFDPLTCLPFNHLGGCRTLWGLVFQSAVLASRMVLRKVRFLTLSFPCSTRMLSAREVLQTSTLGFQLMTYN